MRSTAAGLAAFGAMIVAAPQAHASVDAVYVGVMEHNICVTDCKNADKEDGPNVEFQVSFDSPEFLNWAGSPQPYVMASINTSGSTSFAAVGLEWRWDFAEGWAIEPGVGYAVHNGALENKFQGGAQQAEFANNHLLLGSRDLFRTSIGITRDFEGPLEAQVFYEHLSHGNIIGSGHNQGVDQLGIRIGYQFGSR